jgi:hypothetical protein
MSRTRLARLLASNGEPIPLWQGCDASQLPAKTKDGRSDRVRTRIGCPACRAKPTLSLNFSKTTVVSIATDPNSARFELAPEQRTRIKQYVVREQVTPVRERIPVGATLPVGVELRTVPSEWGPWSSRYRYVYAGEQIYLVEPSSRRVVRAID